MTSTIESSQSKTSQSGSNSIMHNCAQGSSMQKVELIEPTENEGVSSKQSWGTQIQIAQLVNLEPTTI